MRRPHHREMIGCRCCRGSHRISCKSLAVVAAAAAAAVVVVLVVLVVMVLQWEADAIATVYPVAVVVDQAAAPAPAAANSPTSASTPPFPYIRTRYPTQHPISRPVIPHTTRTRTSTSALASHPTSLPSQQPIQRFRVSLRTRLPQIAPTSHAFHRTKPSLLRNPLQGKVKRGPSKPCAARSAPPTRSRPCRDWWGVGNGSSGCCVYSLR